MAEGTLLPDPSCLSLWAGERAMAGYFLLRDGEPGGVLPKMSPLSTERLSPSGRLGVPSREPTALRYTISTIVYERDEEEGEREREREREREERRER